MMQFKRRQGIALVMALLMLVVLLMLGISGVQHIQMDERVSHNARDHNLSFQAAESALADGEAYLAGQTEVPVGVTSCGSPPCAIYASGLLPDLAAQSHSWWSTNAQSYRSSLGAVATQPQFIIEESQFVPYELSPEAQALGLGTHYYRITARGTGGSDNAQSMVESIFSVFFR